MWPDIFTVIDFETTGLKPAEDRVVEMGIARFEGGALVETGNWLCNPHRPYPEKIAKMCKIDPAWLPLQPDFLDCWLEAEELFEGASVVAYNAPFDRRFLLAELHRGGIGLPSTMARQWLDPRRLVEFLLRGKLENHKLTTVAEHFGIALGDDAHAALGDARATGEVLLRLDELFADQLGDNHAELLLFQNKCAAQREAAYRGGRRKLTPGAGVVVHQCDGCHDCATNTQGGGLPRGWKTDPPNLSFCGPVCREAGLLL